MEQERVASRRKYSAQMKALVLDQCTAPGASVAKVALSHGINANIVHRWRQHAREGAGVTPLSVREFVPVVVPASAHQDPADIRIELRRGATTMAITWPAAAASECATWMREMLR